jgi:hypothetical protein
MRNAEILARFDKKIKRLRWGKRFLWLAAAGNFLLLLGIILSKILGKNFDPQGYLLGAGIFLMWFSSAPGLFIVKDALELEKEAQDYIMDRAPMENPLFRLWWFDSPFAIFVSPRWSSQLTLAPLIFMAWVAPFINFILVAWLWWRADSAMSAMRLTIQEDREFFEKEKNERLKRNPSGKLWTDSSFVYAKEDELDFLGYEHEIERQKAFGASVMNRSEAEAKVDAPINHQ